MFEFIGKIQQLLLDFLCKRYISKMEITTSLPLGIAVECSELKYLKAQKASLIGNYLSRSSKEIALLSDDCIDDLGFSSCGLYLTSRLLTRYHSQMEEYCKKRVVELENDKYDPLNISIDTIIDLSHFFNSEEFGVKQYFKQHWRSNEMMANIVLARLILIESKFDREEIFLRLDQGRFMTEEEALNFLRKGFFENVFKL